MAPRRRPTVCKFSRGSISFWISATAWIRFSWARPAFTSRIFPAMKIRGGGVAPFEHETEPASWIFDSIRGHADVEFLSKGSHIAADDELSDQWPGTVHESSFQIPSINVSEMAQAIQWTSEMNRKLRAAAEGSRALMDPNYEFQQVPQFHASNLDPLRGGGRDFTTEVYRIPLVGIEDSAASIFNAASPWRSKERSFLPWAADFNEYLSGMVEILTPQGSEKQQSSGTELELSLALIYLDRATSLETPRAADVPPCPFATPRTAPRLALTAMLLAISSVRCIEDMSHLYAKVESAFGIPTSDCHKMVGWMRAALGDVGMFVTAADLRDWKQLWEARFSP